MAKGKQANAISPSRQDDYPEWYQQVIKAADLAELSPVRGCMVIKPWGYAIWEKMQRVLDRMFKESGHVNAYFPLFIPLSYLEKEAQHVEGFAKECAVVTHHRLELDSNGKLQPVGKLEEPLVVRPTSETIIGEMFSRWVQSYRDLPILMNQWANVVRWEMRTRMFLRTTEFLWQEGHTAHASSEEAQAETKQMLEIYAKFAEQYMAMPVIQGEKTAGERFPGAVATYAIEAMMQDCKALQAGTSHFLGQNFAKAQNIKYLSAEGREEFAWTTSWGVSTRLVGGLVMTHSDDDGLVLPPRLAPKQIVILPITPKEPDRAPVLEYCEKLAAELSALQYGDTKLQVEIDRRDLRGGEKVWQQIKKGVPIRLEIGPRDVQSDSVFMGRRNFAPTDKTSLPRTQFVATVCTLLDEIQQSLFDRAASFRKANTVELKSLDEFRSYFTPSNQDKPEIHGGFAMCNFSEDPGMEELLKELKVTIRCIPLNDSTPTGPCLFTGRPATDRAVFAKAY